MHDNFMFGIDALSIYPRFHADKTFAEATKIMYTQLIYRAQVDL